MDKYWYLKLKVDLESKQMVKDIKGYLRVTVSVEGNQNITTGKMFEVSTESDGTAEVDLDVKLSEVGGKLFLTLHRHLHL